MDGGDLDRVVSALGSSGPQFTAIAMALALYGYIRAQEKAAREEIKQSIQTLQQDKAGLQKEIKELQELLRAKEAEIDRVRLERRAAEDRADRAGRTALG